MLLSRLFHTFGALSTAFAVEILSAPEALTPTNHVQLASYNFTQGLFSTEIFVHDDGKDKNVFVYYTDAQGKSSPLTVLAGEQSDELGDDWVVFKAYNLIFPSEGLGEILNITFESVSTNETFVQELNLKIEGDGTELPAEEFPEPKIHPSGYSDDIDEWLNPGSLDSQAYKAKTRVFDNIGAEGAVPGLVIASPSHGEDTENPDYFYHWARDAGLTFDSLFKLYQALPNRDSPQARKLEDYFLQFIVASVDQQRDETAIAGLGEPKFYAKNNTGYKLLWGRPQNDGPAIRAYAVIEFVKEYIKKGGDRNYIIDLTWEEPIKVDLDYTEQVWQNEDMDSWEETRSHHFFNRMLQRKALIQGAEFASEYLRDVSSYKTYIEASNAINATLEKFISPARNLILNNYGPPLHAKISYKDLSTVLGLTNGYLGDGVFSPTNDYSLRTVFEHATTFLEEYQISQTFADEEGRPLAPPTGRYPEDLYNGTANTKGNPWFLSTNTIAQFFFTIVKEYQESDSIHVSELSLPFWRYYTGVTEVGEISKDSEQFKQVIQSLIGWGDAYIRTVKHWAGEDGHLSEQFDRDTGVLRGARDLTWSYASLISTAVYRAIARGDDGYATALALLDGDVQ